MSYWSTGLQAGTVPPAGDMSPETPATPTILSAFLVSDISIFF
jgi:hypothetical protein